MVTQQPRGTTPTLVSVQPSPRVGKKLVATFRIGDRLKKVHFGAAGYMDYILYTRERGPAYAGRRRARYIARHASREDWTDVTSPGCLSRYLLWEAPTLERAIASFVARFGC